ncbi:MAG: hypothetical protein R2725_02520 [Solirubrobacterales bacterium]
MDILRNLFGAVTSGIIRLLVAVGILAAAYFFIVKPVLHTTDNAIKEANKSIESSTKQIDLPNLQSVIVKSAPNSNLARELKRSVVKAQKRGEMNKLMGCIQRAQGDIPKIRRCAKKFS